MEKEIEIEDIYAVNDKELKEELNKLTGRIISITPKPDNFYQVIYEKY